MNLEEKENHVENGFHLKEHASASLPEEAETGNLNVRTLYHICILTDYQKIASAIEAIFW